jgi:tRNA threonylcarbamoyladenosine biosynthesis protein TsaE
VNTSIHLNSAGDTHKLGVLLGSCLENGAFIGLAGKLGAGKTTFTQGLAKQLGVQEEVASPTFLMLNEYHSGRLPLYHFDLYRLQEDLNSNSSAALCLKSELDEIMQSGQPAVVVVEWIDLWEDFSAEYDELRISIDYQEGTEGRLAGFREKGDGSALLVKRLSDGCRSLG